MQVQASVSQVHQQLQSHSATAVTEVAILAALLQQGQYANAMALLRQQQPQIQ